MPDSNRLTKLETLFEVMQGEVTSLRESRHQHANDIHKLGGKVETVTDELKHVAKAIQDNSKQIKELTDLLTKGRGLAWGVALLAGFGALLAFAMRSYDWLANFFRGVQ